MKVSKTFLEDIEFFISDDEIFSSLMKISEFVKNSEKYRGKCFIAGGFVRDFIMSNPSKDIDICVELENGGIDLANDLAKHFEINTVVVFERFGTAMLPMPGIDFEFVQTRTEQYSEENGRKPEVAFGTIEDDVKRRDFTVNSLLMSLDDFTIYDYVGGIEDIDAKVIRTPNEPMGILKDDPLRILRAIRFAGRFKWRIEESLDTAIRNSVQNLENISKERVTEEIQKMIMKFSASHAEYIVDYNLQGFVTGDVNYSYEPAAFRIAMAKAAKYKNISFLYEEAFYATNESIIEKNMRNMKLSKDEINLMKVLRFGRNVNWSSRLFAHKMNMIGHADLANKLYNYHNNKSEDNQDFPSEWLEAPIITFNGNDLQSICPKKKGKWIAEATNAQIEEWDKNPYYTIDDLKKNEKFMKAIEK